jgi:hypothetical protein
VMLTVPDLEFLLGHVAGEANNAKDESALSSSTRLSSRSKNCSPFMSRRSDGEIEIDVLTLGADYVLFQARLAPTTTVAIHVWFGR